METTGIERATIKMCKLLWNFVWHRWNRIISSAVCVRNLTGLIIKKRPIVLGCFTHYLTDATWAQSKYVPRTDKIELR